jgi:type III secretory pathway component EscS
MQYYAPVLTALRFIAVCVVLYYAYALISLALTSYPESMSGNDGMGQMLKFGKNQTMMHSIKAIVAGSTLYFLAPLFSRIITIGSDRR